MRCTRRLSVYIHFSTPIQSSKAGRIAFIFRGDSPPKHPATVRERGKAVKVYSATKGTAAAPRQGKTKARCHRRQNPHTYLTLHNIRIGKTPVGWAGSKQEAGQPERGILVSPGLVSFRGSVAPLSDLERSSPSWTADGGRWSACQSDRRSKGRGEKAVIETCEISTTSASLSRQDGAA